MSVLDEGYLAFLSFYFERTWWGLFQILSVPDEGYFRFWAYLMRVISDFERTLWGLFQILSVPDEGYSRNASCALTLISTFYCISTYSYGNVISTSWKIQRQRSFTKHDSPFSNSFNKNVDSKLIAHDVFME